MANIIDRFVWLRGSFCRSPVPRFRVYAAGFVSPAVAAGGVI